MKIFRKFGRNIRDAFRNVLRNFSLSTASIACITITLFVVALSLILTYNVENFTLSIKKDVTVVIFLNSKVTKDRVDEIENEIKATGNVYDLQFKSKTEAADDAMKENPIFKTIMQEWTVDNNPLLDSFKLKVNDINKIKETADTIREMDGVSTVTYGEDVVSQLVTVFRVVEKASIIMVAALVLVTAFLIINTIKLTIFSRKTEIEIMRLVGASNFAIKMPFIIEGLILGVIGSIIPIIITIYGYVALYNFFDGKLFNSNLATLIKPTPFVYIASLLLLGIGIVVGMFGSWRASRKYLKI